MERLSNEIIVMTLRYVADFNEPHQPQEQPQLDPVSHRDIYSIRQVSRRYCHLAHEIFAKVIEQKPVRLMEPDLDMLEYITRDEAIYKRMTSCVFSTVIPLRVLPVERDLLPRTERASVEELARAVDEYNRLASKQPRFNHTVVQYLTGIFKRLGNLKVVAMKDTTECAVRAPLSVKDAIHNSIMSDIEEYGNAHELRERDILVISAVLNALHHAGCTPVRIDISNFLSGIFQNSSDLWELCGLSSVSTLSVAPAFLRLHDDSLLRPSAEERLKGAILYGLWVAFPKLIHLQVYMTDLDGLKRFRPLFHPSSRSIHPNLTTIEFTGPFLVRSESNGNSSLANIASAARHCALTLRHLRVFMRESNKQGEDIRFDEEMDSFLVRLARAHEVRLYTLYVQTNYAHSSSLPTSVTETLDSHRRFAQRVFLRVFYANNNNDNDDDDISTEFEFWYREDRRIPGDKEIWEPAMMVTGGQQHPRRLASSRWR